MSSNEGELIAEGYFRGLWKIHLFQESQKLLETFGLLPKELHDLAVSEAWDELTVKLAERNSAMPHVHNVPMMVEADMEVLITGSQLFAEIGRYLFEDSEMTIDEVLMERARVLANDTPIELIMMAHDWVHIGQNS
jgi:hypothetical protein